MKQLVIQPKKPDEKNFYYSKRNIPKDMHILPLRNGMGYKGELKTPWLIEYYAKKLESIDEEQEYGFENILNRTDLLSEKGKLSYLETLGVDADVWSNRARGSMLGLMYGDVFGVPLEFMERDKAPEVLEIIGGGPFQLDKGEWTDDTSTALCLAYSLVHCEGFDLYHQALSYVMWYKYYAYTADANRGLFDIGITIKDALDRFIETGDPVQGSKDIKTSGNGCIMKLAPVPIFYSYDYDKAIFYSAESARVTHQSVECLDACRYMGGIISALVNGESKETVLQALYHPKNGMWKEGELSLKIENIAKGEYKQKTRSQIKSTGYVVDTLEAALWSFYKTETFYEGLVLAVNLAGDSDTIGAVYGQIAGAYYGEANISVYFQRNVQSTQVMYHFVEDFREVRERLGVHTSLNEAK